MSEHGNIVHASDEHAAERPLSAGVGVGRGDATARRTSPHSVKFRLAMATLFLVALAAIGIAAAVLSNGSKRSNGEAWSAWKPVDGGNVGAREIADHLAPLYRITPVDQLSVVTVMNVTNPNTNAATTSSSNTTNSSNGLEVAVRTDPSSSAVSVLGGNTIGYQLCGIGSSNCAIGLGTPSRDRLLLLRREALELALYTFKYIGGVNQVVAILPPGHTVQSCTGICPKPNTPTTTKPLDLAMLFLRGDLSPFLRQPVTATLPEEFPPTVAQMSTAPEAGLVDQITARRLFAERLVQAQDGSSLVLLDPQPPQ